MSRDEHHIVPNSDGGWDVKRDGAERYPVILTQKKKL